MEVALIVRSLGRNRLGALLIGLQIAFTLAIVSNSLSIIEQHLQHMARPTGFDEANIGVLHNQWIGQPDDLKARVLEDLAALRSVPGVVSVEATNSFPLEGSGWITALQLTPDQQSATTQSAVYFVDGGGLSAFGLRLTAGRWFRAGEIGEVRDDETKFPDQVIVTRSLAQALFPSTNPLGQVVYFGQSPPARIIGIVERAQTPSASQTRDHAGVENASFFPYLYLGNDTMYVVRTTPGRLTSVLQTAQEKLLKVTPQRIINWSRTFAEMRRIAYESERKESVVLGIVCGLLLTVTALGVVGLTSYWVSQRTRYIGMRRALGAQRSDILRYFHLENLIIAGIGAVLGIALGVSGNIWLAASFSITRMDTGFVGAGAAIVLALCQAAVIWPALRAASISPAMAFRTR
ncbi:MAG TPA: FtsX-like permease family protein [Steroidobacteraceae bacterium]|nr:FtsX-like permease family protein [Steroidobacteraceae bacterium]